MKQCTTCNIEKDYNAFVFRKERIQGQCKECRNEYVKKYKQERASGIRTKHTLEIVDNGKICRVCNNWKLLDEYPTRKSQHGYRHECKDCKREILNKYYHETYNAVRRDKKKNDIEYRIVCNHRHYIYKCLTRYSLKTQSSIKYIGCDVLMLRKWLEYQFDGDMNWDNYGNVWTIDHVIPLSLFDLENEHQQRIAFHWTNMQPSKDNFQKGKKFRSWEYFNVLISVHRFSQKHKIPDGYQSLRESLDWLRNNSDMVKIP